MAHYDILLAKQLIGGGGGGEESKLPQVADRSVTEITGSDLRGITKIGDYAFANCNKLTSVTMPNSITAIGNYAFNNCSLLESVKLSSTLTIIQTAAFQYSDLKELTIPSSVTYISQGAFSNCLSLKKITSLNTTPPQINPSTFGSVWSKCPIYVPAESVDAYKAAHNWSDRADYIQAIPE